jgi:predicted transcriptional regulator
MVDPPARPDLLVVARILEALTVSDRRLKRTQLQMAAGINYTQLERYLNLLEARGLVVVSKTKPAGTYVDLTSAGYSAFVFLRKSIEEILGSDL